MSLSDLRDGCNPSRGRAAYVSASSPCSHIKPPCDKSVPPVYPDDPDDPDVVLPDCVSLIFSNNEEEPRQFNWSEDDQRYLNGDDFLYYNSGIGWQLSLIHI